MTEGPGVRVEETLVSSRFAENRIKEDESFDLIGALQEAAGTFKGLTGESFWKQCFRGRDRCVSHGSGFCQSDAVTSSLQAQAGLGMV